MTAQNGLDVHRGHASHAALWDNQHALQQRVNFRRSLGLDCAHHHVFAPFPPPPRLIQHAERLAHASRISEENLEATAPVILLLGLKLTQQLLRIRTALG
jgi:hypothetical protein